GLRYPTGWAVVNKPPEQSEGCPIPCRPPRELNATPTRGALRSDTTDAFLGRAYRVATLASPRGGGGGGVRPKGGGPAAGPHRGTGPGRDPALEPARRVDRPRRRRAARSEPGGVSTAEASGRPGGGRTSSRTAAASPGLVRSMRGRPSPSAPSRHPPDRLRWR